MELVNVENGRVLALRPRVALTVGRGADSGISSLTVSRNHCTIVYAPISPGSTNSDGLQAAAAEGREPEVRLTVLHSSGVAVIRGAQARQLGLEPLLLLPARSSCQLYPGDKIYLERNKDARLVSGLQLRLSPGTGHSGDGDPAAAAAAAAAGGVGLGRPAEPVRAPAPEAAPPAVLSGAPPDVPRVAPPGAVAQREGALRAAASAAAQPQLPKPMPAAVPPLLQPSADARAARGMPRPGSVPGSVPIKEEPQQRQVPGPGQAEAAGEVTGGAGYAVGDSGGAVPAAKRQRLLLLGYAAPPPAAAASCPPSAEALPPAASKAPPAAAAEDAATIRADVATPRNGGDSNAVRPTAAEAGPPPPSPPSPSPPFALPRHHQQQLQPSAPAGAELSLAPASPRSTGAAAAETAPEAALRPPEALPRKRRRSGSPPPVDVTAPAEGAPAPAATSAAPAAASATPPSLMASGGSPRPQQKAAAAAAGRMDGHAAASRSDGGPPHAASAAAAGGPGPPFPAAASSCGDGPTPSVVTHRRQAGWMGGAAAPAPAGPDVFAARGGAAAEAAAVAAEAAPGPSAVIVTVSGSARVCGGVGVEEGPAAAPSGPEPVPGGRQPHGNGGGGQAVRPAAQEQGAGLLGKIGPLPRLSQQQPSPPPPQQQQQQDAGRPEQGQATGAQPPPQLQPAEPMKPEPTEPQARREAAVQRQPADRPPQDSETERGVAPPAAGASAAAVWADDAAAAAEPAGAAPYQHAASSAAASTAAAATPSTQPGVSSGGSGGGRPRGGGGGGGIFSGCRFVFWARSQARDVLARVKQAGGQEQYRVGPCTTHVVARYDTTADEAARLLSSLEMDSDTSTTTTATATTTTAAAIAPSPFSALPSLSSTPPPLLPPSTLFVTPKYLRDCLAKGRRLDPSPDPTAGHLIALASRPPPEQPQQQQQQQQRPQLHSLNGAAASPAPREDLPQPPERPTTEPRGGRQGARQGGESPAGGARRRSAAAERVEVAGAGGGAGDGAGTSPTQRPPPPPQQLVGRGSGSPAAAVPAAAGRVQGQLLAAAPGVPAVGGGAGGGGRVLPSPDDVCARAEDWGVGNRWIEPWEPEAASRTCMRLLSHWAKHSYQADAGPMSPAAQTAAAAAAGKTHGSGGNDNDGSGGRGSGAGGEKQRRHGRRRSTSSGGADTSDEGEAGQGARRGAPARGTTTGDTAASVTAVCTEDRLNTVCSHRCCAARSFCILAELKRTRDLYMGREDQFRIKAIDRAMGVLVRLTQPLDSPDQLRQLHLGRGSEEKVAQILATGRFSRNDLYEQNEKRMTLMKFMQVWGCGESTARSWWAAGARSLDDVRQRTDLTAQHRLGLRHFDDFQRRIPRVEVDQVVAVVRQATVDALKVLTAPLQLSESDLTDRLHVRPMGSYARGSDSSADVDFIIAPSAQADPRVSPYDLLVALVERLGAGGHLDAESARMVETRQDHFRSPHKPPPIRLQPQLLTRGSGDVDPDSGGDDTEPETDGGGGGGAGGGGRGRRQQRRRGAGAGPGPRSPRKGAASSSSGGGGSDAAVESATWLGVWRQPSGRYCRIDIKCYRRRLLPFAVAYFSSGMDFNRALRYWAGWPVPQVRELARRLHTRAEAFRLSDKELAVVERREAAPAAAGEAAAAAQGGGPGGTVEVIVGTLPCSCETDIFRALGLDYVPPHMRDITRVE